MAVLAGEGSPGQSWCEGTLEGSSCARAGVQSSALV